MQVAALLSDLKSLSACDHAAALSFVSAHRKSSLPPIPAPTQVDTTTTAPTEAKTLSHSQAHSPSSQAASPHPIPNPTAPPSDSSLEAEETSDPDLHRALSLLSLHSQKVRWQEQMLNNSSGGGGGGGDPEPELTRLRIEVEKVARERGI